jgi:hypothetical protein
MVLWRMMNAFCLPSFHPEAETGPLSGKPHQIPGTALSFNAAVLFDVMPKSLPCLTLIFSGFLKEV